MFVFSLPVCFPFMLVFLFLSPHICLGRHARVQLQLACHWAEESRHPAVCELLLKACENSEPCRTSCRQYNAFLFLASFCFFCPFFLKLTTLITLHVNGISLYGKLEWSSAIRQTYAIFIESMCRKPIQQSDWQTMSCSHHKKQTGWRWCVVLLDRLKIKTHMAIKSLPKLTSLLFLPCVTCWVLWLLSSSPHLSVLRFHSHWALCCQTRRSARYTHACVAQSLRLLAARTLF